jgi:hypothetical protein
LVHNQKQMWCESLLDRKYGLDLSRSHSVKIHFNVNAKGYLTAQLLCLENTVLYLCTSPEVSLKITCTIL